MPRTEPAIPDPGHSNPAPYVPFKTFLAAIEGFDRALPNQIDRSLWPSYSGAIRGQLLAALRFLGLVDEMNSPLAALREMVSRPESRKAVLRSCLERHYGPLLALDLTRTSPHQFEEAVRSAYGLSGVTHRKAVSFFLQAAQYAGLPLSPLLRAKTRTAAYGHRRVAGSVAASTDASPAISKTLELESGGRLTLTATIDLFRLTPEDRAFVFDLIDRMRGYGGAPQGPAN